MCSLKCVSKHVDLIGVIKKNQKFVKINLRGALFNF